MENYVSSDMEVKRRLKFAVALTVMAFAGELIGGYLTNSLALLSDAGHVLMDAVALALSLSALYVCALPSTEKKTYGLHRVEVFVSFINGATLTLLALFIFYKAYLRFMEPLPVKTLGMMVVAIAGLAINLTVAARLSHFSKTDLNVKSAFLHVIGDAAASVGVIAGAILIHFTGIYAIDPVISVLIGAIILFGSLKIVRESAHILLEGVPKDISFNRVVVDIKGVEGVTDVHSLHIWSICHNVHALSAHIDINRGHIDRQSYIFKNINERLAENYRIFYTTLQAECPGCEGNNMLRKIEHRE